MLSIQATTSTSVTGMGFDGWSIRLLSFDMGDSRKIRTDIQSVENLRGHSSERGKKIGEQTLNIINSIFLDYRFFLQKRRLQWLILYKMFAHSRKTKEKDQIFPSKPHTDFISRQPRGES